ncbi:PAS domain-containing hybrid sensor histidine kinase/response regulator [Kistimonas scapharcae]|uniref:histidine kinase n=1 Tax=Kistimonas scapharcae TaxID=1036133 RepID=A0ABP8V281_9GAMM
MSGVLIALVSLFYVGALFAVAWYGDRNSRTLAQRWQPWIYSLSLAVYCTSWTFFGAVGQAALAPWSFLPIYVAPILVFILLRRLLTRMILISKQQNITSIADFLAARYGKSRLLAAVATVILLLGILPYIALQLKAIVMGYTLLSAGSGLLTVSDSFNRSGHDTALIVSLVLAAFTVLFGTRHLDATEHHHGVMLAIAVESVIKLVAFIAVGVFVVYACFGDAVQPWRLFQNSVVSQGNASNIHFFSLLPHILLSMAAFLCLPRQFHVMVVENADIGHLKLARRVFSLYLVLAGIFVLPIALAGKRLLPEGVLPDTYVISLPLSMGQEWLAMLAFIGGASAAISMVIVATIALTIMISNELIVPLLVRRQSFTGKDFSQLKGMLLSLRRSLILVILLLAYLMYRLLEQGQSLASIGYLSFTAVAQLAPALIGGLVWRESNRMGVLSGLLIGMLIWFCTLVLPVIQTTGFVDSNVADVGQWHSSTWGMLLSLGGNLIAFVLGSFWFRPTVMERQQAAVFVGTALPEEKERLPRVTVAELETLAARFIGQDKTTAAFSTFAGYAQPALREQQAPQALIDFTERLLARVLGGSSARVVMRSALSGDAMGLDDVETIIGESSSVLRFNRELLQGALENVSQGISVVDRDLRLVAWNQTYLALFDYPEGFICIGRHVSDIIRHNATQGLCGPGDIEAHVRKRVKQMAQGNAHRSERVRADGRVIQVQGNPMPGGGFVMSFTDITGFRRVEQALKEMNESLEQRVSDRTRDLESANMALRRAKQQAEQASHDRSRFFATISHDLMQPLNAARLFSATLSEQVGQTGKDSDEARLAGHIETSLRSAEEIINDLLDLSRLESGKLKPSFSAFTVTELFEPLMVECQGIATSQGVTVHHWGGHYSVYSDRKLLRRVLQNFLCNAIRYAPAGRVMLGCRRQGNYLRIEVRDNGPGIPEERQAQIFNAFQRLDGHVSQGFGLGLAIVQGIASVLRCQIGLKSHPGQGSVFFIVVPLRQRSTIPVRDITVSTLPLSKGDMMSGRTILCIDNDLTILKGMRELLERWGCRVLTAVDSESAKRHLTYTLDAILVDYHLDNGSNGVDVIRDLRHKANLSVPTVMITADGSAQLREQLKGMDIRYLSKPLKPAALRALLSRLLRDRRLGIPVY